MSSPETPHSGCPAANLLTGKRGGCVLGKGCAVDLQANTWRQGNSHHRAFCKAGARSGLLHKKLHDSWTWPPGGNCGFANFCNNRGPARLPPVCVAQYFSSWSAASSRLAPPVWAIAWVLAVPGSQQDVKGYDTQAGRRVRLLAVALLLACLRPQVVSKGQRY